MAALVVPGVGRHVRSVVLVVCRDRDGLAALGIGAVGGVQAPGPSDEPGVDLATRLEALDAPVDVGEVPLHQPDDVMAGGLALAAQLEDRADLRERETTVLRVADEAEALHRFRSVVAIAVRRTRRRRHEADVLVVADGRGGESGLVCDVADLHLPMIPLDIRVDFKV